MNVDQDLDSRNFQESTRRQSYARSTSLSHENKSQSPMSKAHALPAFIKPVPEKYGADDIAYLAKKGALSIPSPPLRDALLESFINFIYPFMPLLDLQELLDIIENNDENSAISLLLFQAIMFASTASVDMTYLKAAGYNSRRDARRDFFQKTRVCVFSPRRATCG